MLLDTCFLIDLQDELRSGRSRGAYDLLRRRGKAVPRIALVSWLEFAEGFDDAQEEACRLFLAQFQLILPTAAIAWRASRISRNLRASGNLIADHDLWIAATALEEGVPLVTRDSRHFARVPGLTIVRY